MSCFIQDGFYGTTYDMQHPRLCWQRATGTAAASTEAAGFSAAFANNVRLDSFWRPTTTTGNWTLTLDANDTVGYIGIAAHDLATQGAVITVQYKLDAGDWTDLSFGGETEIAPADNDPVLFLIDPIEVSAVRLVLVSADAAPTIGVIAAGEVDEWTRKSMWVTQPITEGDRITFANNSSETGVFVGRTVISDGLEFTINVENQSEAWRIDAFKEFKAYANKGEGLFFYADRPLYEPDELSFCWLSRTAKASRGRPNRAISTSVTLNCVGYRQDL